MATDSTTEASTGPNLIFVFADQLGYTRLGYAGDPRAKTPNIDRLASQSVNFRQAVASMPVCAAYRATLLTGKYTTSTGMVINELRVGTDHECFGHVLSRGGYRTAWVGKWHLYANQLGRHDDARNSFTPPGPNRLGFDGYWASYGFHHQYYRGYYHTDTPEKLSYGEGVYEPNGQTDLAIKYLRRAAKVKKVEKAGEPFALFLSYGTPHDPWNPHNVPKKYLRMFKDVQFPYPPNYKNEDDKYADGWGRLKPDQRAELPEWRRVYYAMVANLDWNIGRLTAALDELGLAEDTVLVFSSDHGEMFGAQGPHSLPRPLAQADFRRQRLRRPGQQRRLHAHAPVAIGPADPRRRRGHGRLPLRLGPARPRAQGRLPPEHRRLRRLGERPRVAGPARQAVHLRDVSRRPGGTAVRQRRRSLPDAKPRRRSELQGHPQPLPRNARGQDEVRQRHVPEMLLVPRPLDPRPHHHPNRQKLNSEGRAAGSRDASTGAAASPGRLRRGPQTWRCFTAKILHNLSGEVALSCQCRGRAGLWAWTNQTRWLSTGQGARQEHTADDKEFMT